jgi:hypothetical protein
VLDFLAAGAGLFPPPLLLPPPSLFPPFLFCCFGIRPVFADRVIVLECIYIDCNEKEL